MEEIWKQHNEHPAVEISNLGNVRYRDSKKVLIPVYPKGSAIVNYSIDGIKHSFSLSKVILEAFYGKTKKRVPTTHIDGNNRNNRIDNLKWYEIGEGRNLNNVWKTKRIKGTKIEQYSED